MIGSVQGLSEWAAARGIALPASGLENALKSATARLESITGRTLTVSAAPETLTVEGADDPTLFIPDMVEVNAVTINGATVDATMYRVLPLNSTPKSCIYRKNGLAWLNPDMCTITVTGKRGYRNPAPEDLVDLAYLLAANDLTASANEGLKRIQVLNVTVEMGSSDVLSKVEGLAAHHRRVSL